jgi:quinol monooxygenase YgiN
MRRHHMIVNSIHFTFSPKDAGVAESLLRELRDASQKEKGVIQYEVGRSSERPNVFALWEVYRDQAAVDVHLTSEHFQRLFVTGLRPLVQDRSIERVVPI